MARPKAFDRDQALLRASDLFQTKGFEATSIQDLVDRLGINRQSLYDTFGDKEALYQAALQRYRGDVHGPMADLLLGPLPLRRCFATLFSGAVDHLLSPDGHPCFLAQAALERAASHRETGRRVNAGYQEIRALFAKRLERAHREGEIGAHHDPLALANFLHNALQGLQITARAGAGRANLEQIVRVTLSVLG